VGDCCNSHNNVVCNTVGSTKIVRRSQSDDEGCCGGRVESVSRGYACCTVTSTTVVIAEAPRVCFDAIIEEVAICIIDDGLSGIPVGIGVCVKERNFRV